MLSLTVALKYNEATMAILTKHQLSDNQLPIAPTQGLRTLCKGLAGVVVGDC